jgi:hypothetical protein
VPRVICWIRREIPNPCISPAIKRFQDQHVQSPLKQGYRLRWCSRGRANDSYLKYRDGVVPKARRNIAMNPLGLAYPRSTAMLVTASPAAKRRNA